MKQSITNTLLKTLTPQAKPFEIRDTQVKGFILRVQPSGVMTYYADYARGKRAKLGSASILTPTQAREQAKSLLADTLKGHDPAETKRKAKAHSLGSFLSSDYKAWAETSIKTHKATLARLQASYAELLPLKLDAITPFHVDRIRVARKKEGVKNSSINRELDDLKACLNKAVEWGHITENALAKVKRYKVDNNAKVRYLTQEEEQRLRQALEQREQRNRTKRTSHNEWLAERGHSERPALTPFVYSDHLTPMVLLALNTGLRRGELFNLTWDNVNLSKPQLTVAGEGAKSGKTRHIPLNKEALTVLTRWQQSTKATHGLVFPSENGQRFNNINKSWNNLLDDASIEGFRFHDLRHDFASKLVMRGTDLNTVRELLGHSDYAMTLRYAHLAPEHKQEAVDRLMQPC
jgi:integrase